MAQSKKTTSESIVRDIKRNTRRHFLSEEKIRIVLDGLRGYRAGSDNNRSKGTAGGERIVKAASCRDYLCDGFSRPYAAGNILAA